MYYEDLSAEEKRSLTKEFQKVAPKRYLVMRGIGMVLMILALISVCFAMYYIIIFLFNRALSVAFYVCAGIFNVSGICALILTSRYFKKYNAWLKETKNIDRKSNEQNILDK